MLFPQWLAMLAAGEKPGLGGLCLGFIGIDGAMLRVIPLNAREANHA